MVVIRAGENATAAHDGEPPKLEATFMTLAQQNSLVAFALYDFSASGPGTFTFDPVSKFKVIGPNEITCDEAADAHSISITIADVSKRELKFEKRRIISCGDEGKAGFIGAAVLEATVLASWAATYIEDNKGGPLFQKYFGDNDFKAIHSNFLTLAKSDKSSLSLNCANCGGSELAQSSNQEFKVHFCSAFFNQLPIGSLCGQSPKTTFGARNLRGGVSLRYMARALIQGVIDGGDGCPDTQSGNGFERRLSDRNYEVSTLTLRCLPRTRMLIWGRDLCSASLLSSILKPSAPIRGNESPRGSNCT